jgi:hypothetical protein
VPAHFTPETGGDFVLPDQEFFGHGNGPEKQAWRFATLRCGKQALLLPGYFFITQPTNRYVRNN